MYKLIRITILCMVMLLISHNLLADNGLIAYYAFEDGCVDSSGNGLHGTVYGLASIVYDTDRESRVLLLDGYNDYVDLGNDILFDWSGAFSAAFWVKVNEWQENWDTILKKNDVWSFERNVNNEEIAFYHWPNFSPTATQLSSDGRWHHITATYDGTTQKLYKDGILVQSVSNVGDMNINSNHVYIGTAGGTDRFFKGRLDDIRFYSRILTENEINVLGDADIHFTGNASHVFEVQGNYELNIELDPGQFQGTSRVFFSANPYTSIYAFLEISGNVFNVGRMYQETPDIWKTVSGIGSPPYNIKILKKGNFFRFWVNEATSWIRGPLGEWHGMYDPYESLIGVITYDSSIVKSFSVTTLPWLQQITEALIPKGPAGSYYENQVIPGGIVKYENNYYMYFMAGKVGTQEGARERTIGVAVSADLYNWQVQPEPILSYEDLGDLGDNLYPSGAVITPEDKIALMYSVQKYPDWQGFFLATADDPLGPFENYAANPVYKHFTHAHEFDLVRVDEPNRRYIMMFAGFTPEPTSGTPGDRGYALYSNDLMNWTEDPLNPVFSPSTLDNWDAIHVRTRSLNKIGDTWYVWYEGCNHWSPPDDKDHHGWWDTIGLARSQDLHNWEYYPRNPAFPALGIGSDQFDSNWVGWPRMFVENDTGYVFYTGNGVTGMRTIAIDQLTNWESEGGVVTGVADGSKNSNPKSVARDFELFQNYPNPFNPSTYISFTLGKASEVTVSIYNTIGQKLWSSTTNYSSPGKYGFYWNGTDQRGNRVGTGVFFYELRAGDFRTLRKMILIT